MKKIALVFVLVVFVPSLVLAWLAVRSLRDQQLILERQQSLLCQGVADSLAKEADNYLAGLQHDFGQQVEAVLANRQPAEAAHSFNETLLPACAPANVGFAVTLSGAMISPSPVSSPAAQIFCADFGKFLGNRETVEVYSANNAPYGNASKLDANANYNSTSSPQQPGYNFSDAGQKGGNQKMMNSLRQVTPVQQNLLSADNNGAQFSKVSPSEAEFRQLIGDSMEGTIARFVENKLSVLMWYRSARDTNYVFGAQLSLPWLKTNLRQVVERLDPALRGDIAVALLDDTAKPVAVSQPGFSANWKHPFVATELGEALPHWEMAVYLLDPAKLAQSARTLKLTLGLLIVALLAAIGAGGWLIVADLNRQLALARQKTDFVSNVSHEFKTPLTSIRMFSELLAEGRVAEPEKRQTYLNIITAEASRLTRLINNVLDFSRMERGEKKYNFEECDLAGLTRGTVETYRPHLEANGFRIQIAGPDSPMPVRGDRDALAQVVVNLLSNAEKYSDAGREIAVEVEAKTDPLPHAEVRILDRGPGVPRGCEAKIFEQFYRAHDSLSSGIQGSGLGLTLARQIAQAHGGDVVFRPREGGGSCFILRLPTMAASGERAST